MPLLTPVGVGIFVFIIVVIAGLDTKSLLRRPP